MIICCLGDSLTAGDYGVPGKSGIANVQAKNYPFFLGEFSGAQVRNFGRCGYRATDYLAYYLTGDVDLQNADIILIMLGTNGGMEPAMDTADNQAYLALIGLCREAAPRARLCLCTPPHATRDPAMSNCGYAPQAEKAAEFVRKAAQQESLFIVDLACCADFCDETESVMQPNDGLHFSELGYRKMAEFIWNALKKSSD